MTFDWPDEIPPDQTPDVGVHILLHEVAVPDPQRTYAPGESFTVAYTQTVNLLADD